MQWHKSCSINAWVTIYMHQVNTKISSFSADTNERRLLRAQKHVNEYWFPANPKLVQRIRAGLDGGAYDLDIGFLIAEVKTDFALLTYCLREITRLLNSENIPIPDNAGFADIIELAGLKKVKRILDVAPENISSHSVDHISEEQALRLQEAMISASTAEVLSENNNLGADIGFSAALTRQLGHTLISWNYPSVYQRCLSSVSATKTLDTLLTESLGFSPQLLAYVIIEEWGLHGNLRDILLEDSKTQRTGEELSSTASTLKKICSIGEALARANDPEHYPSAERDWEEVKVALEETLGYEGIKLIQEKVKLNCESYMSLMPEMFKRSENINPDTQINDFIENSLLRNNQFVKHCPPRLRKRFKNFYTLVHPGEIAREALAFLVKEIIPFAGFNGGFIYTLDPTSMQLVPRTKIGTSVEKDMQPIKYDPATPDSDPVSTAFGCSVPIVQSSVSNSLLNDRTALVAGAVGNSPKIGVLYLELPSELLAGTEHNMLLHYKAIRQALNDCFII